MNHNYWNAMKRYRIKAVTYLDGSKKFFPMYKKFIKWKYFHEDVEINDRIFDNREDIHGCPLYYFSESDNKVFTTDIAKANAIIELYRKSEGEIKDREKIISIEYKRVK